MARARRGRVNLLGIDPSYTRQAEREGGGADPIPEAATLADTASVAVQEMPAAQPVPPVHEAAAPHLAVSEAVDAEHQDDRAPSAATGMDEGALSQPPQAATPRFARQVRFSLSSEGTERLQAISRDQGVAIPVITKALRGRVSADLHRMLQTGQKPSDQRVHRGGHAERILIRLEGAARQRAQLWFDPMELGEDALADAMRPVLARLFEDHLRRLDET